MSDFLSEKIEQYERKLKQAEKAGKHNKAKKYQEKLERLRAEAAEQSMDSDTDSDDDDIDSDNEADQLFALDEEPDVAPEASTPSTRCVTKLAGFHAGGRSARDRRRRQGQEKSRDPARKARKAESARSSGLRRSRHAPRKRPEMALRGSRIKGLWQPASSSYSLLAPRSARATPRGRGPAVFSCRARRHCVDGGHGSHRWVHLWRTRYGDMAIEYGTAAYWRPSARDANTRDYMMIVYHRRASLELVATLRRVLHMRRIPYLDAQNLNDEQWSVPAGGVREIRKARLCLTALFAALAWNVVRSSTTSSSSMRRRGGI